MKIKIPDIEIPDVLWEGLSAEEKSNIESAAGVVRTKLKQAYLQNIEFPTLPEKYKVSKARWGSVFIYRTTSDRVQDVDKSFLLALEEVCSILNIDIDKVQAPEKRSNEIICRLSNEVWLTVYFHSNEVCHKVVQTKTYEDVTYICNS